MLEMEPLSFSSSDNLPLIQLRPNCLVILPCSIFNEIANNERAPPSYVEKGHLLASQKERRARCFKFS